MNTMNNQELAQKLLETTQAQADHVAKMITVVDRLDEEIMSKPSKRSAYGFTAILCAFILVVTSLIGWKLIDVSSTNHDTLKLTSQNLALVEDCVNPEGECAKRSAAQTQVVVNQIICNQERLAFILVDNYNPNPICISYIEETTGKKVGGG